MKDNSFCCPECFNDDFLKNHITAESEKLGKCGFCQSLNVPILDVIKLNYRFEPLLSLYAENPNGAVLSELLQNDWDVFSIKSKRTQLKLLSLLSKDNSLKVKRFIPIHKKENNHLEQWERFKEELKHTNRFFPSNAIDVNHLEPFGKHLGVIINKGSQKFYRARINPTSKPISIKFMGKPPKTKVLNGRANPIGIPYLYLASTIETAIAEIKGYKGEVVTIAEFEMKSKLELADLRSPTKSISPFELNDDNELELIYKNMPYLIKLGDELSKPVIPKEENLEYLPTQYLCEMFKQLGFHGIIYKSAISEGTNFVIFKDKRMRAVATNQYVITGLKSSFKKY